MSGIARLTIKQSFGETKTKKPVHPKGYAGFLRAPIGRALGRAVGDAIGDFTFAEKYDTIAIGGMDGR